MATALVRRPGPHVGEGIVTHVPRTPVDPGRALEQWQAYVAVLAAAGWSVVEVPPADDCPDAVFVEDALVVAGGLAVATRPGAEPRRPEVGGVAEAAAALGLRVERIEAPATLDGGDVLVTAHGVQVGVGGRTNDAGADQLEALLGVEVQRLPVAGVLHLKSSRTALPDGSLVDANVLDLGGGRVLLSADRARTAALVAARGYEPVTVDISELRKLEGDVTCLSILIRD
jgi:dimethylargininase